MVDIAFHVSAPLAALRLKLTADYRLVPSKNDNGRRKDKTVRCVRFVLPVKLMPLATSDRARYMHL